MLTRLLRPRQIIRVDKLKASAKPGIKAARFRKKDSSDVAPAREGPDTTGGKRGLKTEATRRALIDATISIVGQSGYAEASIARITAKAGIAQGTFYNYFSSQQDLFDHMLPLMGQEMLDRVRAARRQQSTAAEKEQAGFQAYFDYLLEYPEFYRILNEAETFAPRGYRQHIENMVAGYVRSLARARDAHEIGDFDDRELEAIAYMLISTRLYLGMRYTYWDGEVSRVPAWVGETYMKLLQRGIFTAAAKSAGRKNGERKIAAGPAEEANSRPVLLEVMPDRALVQLDLQATNMDLSGRNRRARLLDLAETAAASCLEADGLGPFVLMDFSVRMIRPLQDGKLFAEARCLDRGNTIALTTVDVRQHQPDGQLVAAAQISFRRQ